MIMAEFLGVKKQGLGVRVTILFKGKCYECERLFKRDHSYRIRKKNAFDGRIRNLKLLCPHCGEVLGKNVKFKRRSLHENPTSTVGELKIVLESG